MFIYFPKIYIHGGENAFKWTFEDNSATDGYGMELIRSVSSLAAELKSERVDHSSLGKSNIQGEYLQ
ncbi:MAG: hypothetical protein Q8Q81_02895 [Oxalobacteraceae bacterium]|nr:hypothetical protein [Oxalobacteraceae bacterium]